MKFPRKLVFSLLLIGIFVVIGIFGVLYYKRGSLGRETELSVKIIINYGSLREPKEDIFYRTFPSGYSAYDAFSAVANLTVEYYPFGVYIKGVNGYNEKLPHYWAFYYYDHHTESWVYSEVGVSNYLLKNNDWIKLEYTG